LIIDLCRFSLDLDIAAPKITIPTDFFPDGKNQCKLLVDLGYLTLQTEVCKNCLGVYLTSFFLSADKTERDIYVLLVGKWMLLQFLQCSNPIESKSCTQLGFVAAAQLWVGMTRLSVLVAQASI
jgi:hypothetical protein